MSNKFKPVLVVAGEPKSVFFEILIKSLKFKKYKSPIIIIASYYLLHKEMRKMKYKKKIRLIYEKDLKNLELNNKSLNLIDVSYSPNKNHKKNYIKNSFNVAFRIIKSGFTKKIINGPINKNDFLEKKFLGMTEYISKKFNQKKFAMLIYNKKLSVCPITTHLPIKNVSNKITKNLIIEKALLINNFYKNNFGFKPKIAVTGLNPHCETLNRFNEDDKIVKPAIKKLQKDRLKVKGPFSADTIFLKQNRKNYNAIIGMYHDQVLAPFKTLNEYDAINITLGLPFFRISPDHGPNVKMINKNLSNPLSLIRAIEFLDHK